MAVEIKAATYAALRTALAAGTYRLRQIVFCEAGFAGGYGGGAGFFRVVSSTGKTDDGKDTIVGGALAAVRHTGMGYDAPLDPLFANVAAAYSSSRLLVTDYAGQPLVRVRRSSDDAEMDIGHTATGALDSVALSTFVGGGTGYLVKVYDQLRFGRHAVQATTTLQPVISSGAMVFDGVDDRLAIEQGPTSVSTSFVSAVTMPDGAFGSQSGKGFTCTGLAWDSGEQAFWVGNHGQAVSGVGTPNPSVVKLSLDGSTILDEIDIYALDNTITSVQGVTVDTSDNTLWVACPLQDKILHVTKAGALLGSITVADANGIAYDPRDDRLIVLSNDTITVRTTTGTLVSTYQPHGLSPCDHLHFDAENRVLYVTFDDGDGYANIALFDHDNKALYGSMGPFEENTANEGVAVVDGELYLTGDMFYHSSGSVLNQLLRYSVASMVYPEDTLVSSTNPVVTMIGKGRSTISATACALWSIASSIDDGPGMGVFALNTAGTPVVNELRAFVNGGYGTGERTFEEVAITGEFGTTNVAWISLSVDPSEDESVLTVGDDDVTIATTITQSRLPLIASSEIGADTSVVLRASDADIYEIVFFDAPDSTALAAYRADAEAFYGL